MARSLKSKRELKIDTVPTGPVVLTTADEVLAALQARYAEPEWAFFDSVPDHISKPMRRADGLAMSLWSSRGIEIYGFEIKVSRSDLLRELKNPAKADAIAKYCDRWWVAVGDASIAKPGELPPAWGLLVPVRSKSGVTMKIIKDAKRNDATPVDRTFVAALLRRAAERFSPTRIRNEIMYETARETREAIESKHRGDHEKAIAAREQRIASLTAEIDGIRSTLEIAATQRFDAKALADALALLNLLRDSPAMRYGIRATLHMLERSLDQTTEIVAALRQAQVITQALSSQAPEPAEVAVQAPCAGELDVAG